MGLYDNYCSPINGEYKITSYYGYRRMKGAISHHSGIDIVGIAGTGTPLFAIADGEVVNIVRAKKSKKSIKEVPSGYDAESVTIKLKNPDPNTGISYVFYTHLYQGSTNSLKKNQSISRGDYIGQMGNTGRSTGAHLHFEIRDSNNKKLDPYNFLIGTSEYVNEGKVTIKKESYNNKIVEVNYPDRNDRKKRDGKYLKSDNQQKPPESPTKVSGPPEKEEESKKTNTSAKDKAEEKKIEPITDEEIRASVIGFYMPEIIKLKDAKRPNNIIFLNGGKNTASLQNIILSKGLGGTELGEGIDSIQNFDLANMVPYVRLYKIIDQASGQRTEIEYPFNNYTSRIKLESIFYDKTGRGGDVGIKSVDWKSIATNASNKHFIEAKLKILIQDIREIEMIRNGVSLLDFLYPVGTKTNEYKSKEFDIKLQVGWTFNKNEQMTIKEDMEDIFSQTLNVTLHKHSFEFTESGNVILNLEYIGSIEGEYSNQFEYNVLDKLNPKKKAIDNRLNLWKSLKTVFETNLESTDINILDKDIQDWISKYNKGAANTPGTNAIVKLTEVNVKKYWWQSEREDRNSAARKKVGKIILRNIPPEGKDYEIYVGDIGKIDLKEVIEVLDGAIKDTEKDIQNAFLDGIGNLLNTLEEEEKIKILAISGRLKDSIKKLSLKTGFKDLVEYKNEYSSVAQTTYEKGLSIGNYIVAPDTIQEYLVATKTENSEGNINLSSKKFDEIVSGLVVKDEFLERGLANLRDHFSGDEEYKEFYKVVAERGRQSDAPIVVPYVFLEDIFSYYIKLFFGEDNSCLTNTALRVCLGSFSYRDFGQFEQEAQTAGAGQKNSQRLLDINGNITVRSFQKKYANLGDIPISVSSLINWYNTNILNANIKNLSFMSFIRSLINDIIPANLASNILPFSQPRKLTTSINFLTKEQDLIDEIEGITIVSQNQQEKTYQFEFNDLEKPNPFFRFKKKTKNSTGLYTNYMFIFSSNEQDSELRSDESEDFNKNIAHLYVGSDTGLVRSIKFSREDNKQLDAANIIKANNGDSDSAILRQVYHLDIEMFGNTLFEPGQLIHLTPSYPGSRLRSRTLYNIGLGGYYRIIQIESFIEDGMYKTKLAAKWQFYGEGISQID